MNIVRSHFYAMMSDGSISPLDYQWAKIVSDGAHKNVIALVIQSENGAKSIIERKSKLEQFFQFRQVERVTGIGAITYSNVIGKTINDNGNCVVTIHDCRNDVFCVNVANVDSMIRDSPLNYDLLGLEIKK